MKKSFGKRAVKFLESESGDAAIEYAYLMALLSMVLIVVMKATGMSLSNMFSFVSGTINGAIPTAPPPPSPPPSG